MTSLNSDQWAVLRNTLLALGESRIIHSRPRISYEELWIDYGMDATMQDIYEQHRQESQPFSLVELQCYDDLAKTCNTMKSFNYILEPKDVYHFVQEKLHDVHQPNNAVED